METSPETRTPAKGPTKAFTDLTDERVKNDDLKALEKDRDEKKLAIDKEKNDRKLLVAKGNEECAQSHEQVSLTVDAKRQLVNNVKRQHQALIRLQSDVDDFRTGKATLLRLLVKNAHSIRRVMQPVCCFANRPDRILLARGFLEAGVAIVDKV